MVPSDFDSNDFLAGMQGLSKQEYLSRGLKKAITDFSQLKSSVDVILAKGIDLSNIKDAQSLNGDINEAFVFCFNQNLRDDYKGLFDLQLRIGAAIHSFADKYANKLTTLEDKALLRYLIACKKYIENEDQSKIIHFLLSKHLLYKYEDEYCLVGLHILENGHDEDEEEESYQLQMQAYIFDSDRFFQIIKQLNIEELPEHYEIITDHSPSGGEHLLKVFCSKKDISIVKELFTKKGQA